MIVPFDPADYSIAVRLNKKPRNSWRWEINCPGKCFPIERSASHFETMAAATRARKGSAPPVSEIAADPFHLVCSFAINRIKVKNPNAPAATRVIDYVELTRSRSAAVPLV